MVISDIYLAFTLYKKKTSKFLVVLAVLSISTAFADANSNPFKNNHCYFQNGKQSSEKHACDHPNPKKYHPQKRHNQPNYNIDNSPMTNSPAINHNKIQKNATYMLSDTADYKHYIPCTQVR